MNNIKDVMFVDGVYTSISHIFTGLDYNVESFSVTYLD